MAAPDQKDFQCPLAGCNKDDLKKKYLSMVDDFKSQLTKMLNQSTLGCDEIIQSATSNYERLKESYTKGKSDMTNEILKGNQAMVESFRKNCKIIQKNIDDAYRVFKDDNMDIYSKNVAKFKEQCEQAAQQNASILSSGFGEVTKYLLDKQKKTIESVQTKYNTFAKELQDSYEDSARKLTMTPNDLSANTASGIKK